MPGPGFRIAALDPVRDGAELRALRAAAGTAVDLTDAAAALDALGDHLVARSDDGQAVGAARLGADRRIAALAVLPDWRGRGVGGALLRGLIETAQRRHWPQLELQVPAAALAFCARHGFLPPPGGVAASAEAVPLRRRFDGAVAVEDAAMAIAASIAVLAQARRQVLIHSRALDPGLLDDPRVVEQLRRFAVAAHAKQVRVLLHDAAAPQRVGAPLLALAQRLPSVFQFREVSDPVDRSDATAYLVDDSGGYYFRGLGHRYDGETDLLGGGRARQLRATFDRVWERARPCSELRALGW
ncbi:MULTISPECIES: GNAT family N-acetyltransferase [unclassified Xanthomonas]|uniref:GNAT family N-acetyltransferase n=1 Tax=unclassified Xanthomonas TaxID=2643310 RepID=UPI002A83741E|nr:MULTISPECIES: GNAT family N-acetyltransferase [unclassified Xanthomonas]MDY4296685.1 GNAT family N-acetyltransferase [Xanthomonas sp. LF02-5]MDY4358556.1 GNAT family N-acetyltransferase [Xanthomonas sp. LF04-12]